MTKGVTADASKYMGKVLTTFYQIWDEDVALLPNVEISQQQNIGSSLSGDLMTVLVSVLGFIKGMSYKYCIYLPPP